MYCTHKGSYRSPFVIGIGGMYKTCFWGGDWMNAFYLNNDNMDFDSTPCAMHHPCVEFSDILNTILSIE